MRALAPWTGMTSLRRDMERLFDRFFEPKWDATEAVSGWWPKVDFSETKDAYVVKGEIPGVDEKDIHVSLEDHTLTIKGEKHQEEEVKEERYHRVERSYGEFLRRLELPGAVDAERVTASFKNGLLTVTLPKTAAATKGTTIPIKAA